MKAKISILSVLFAVSIFCFIAGCSLFSGKDVDNSNNGDTSADTKYTEIYTESELRNLENSSGNYKLANDISLSGNWSPINGFSGIFDGCNYSVSNLSISGNSANTGLFSTLKGVVRNLKITDLNITASGIAGTTGAVCGTNEGKIKNVSVSGNINTPYFNNVGGICGQVNEGGLISDCTYKASISGYQNVGGICGYYKLSENLSIANNTNSAEVTGKTYVGGICGQVQGAISRSSSGGYANFTENVNTASVYGTGDYIGGLIGHQSSDSKFTTLSSNCTCLKISGCSNSATISGGDYTGGIVGYGDKLTEIAFSESSADITGGNYVGGYIGYGEDTAIISATNSSLITGKGYIGGIAGYCGALSDCINDGVIYSMSAIVEESVIKAYAGGLAGYATLLSDCTNNAEITVTTGRYVGGLVGYLHVSENGTCAGNQNNGEIRGVDYTGGIVGEFHSPISRSSSGGYANFTENSNTASVCGAGNYVGGLIGHQSSNSKYVSLSSNCTYLTISNCSNTGHILGIGYVGGIIGYGSHCVTTEVVWASNSNSGTVDGSSNTGNLYGYIQ